MFGAKRKFSALSEYFEIDPNATLPGCWGLSVVDENIEGREGRSGGSGSFSSRCPRQSGWALRSRGQYHAIKGVDAWSTYGKPPSDSFTPAVFCADKWPNRINPLPSRRTATYKLRRVEMLDMLRSRYATMGSPVKLPQCSHCS